MSTESVLDTKDEPNVCPSLQLGGLHHNQYHRGLHDLDIHSIFTRENIITQASLVKHNAIRSVENREYRIGCLTN